MEDKKTYKKILIGGLLFALSMTALTASPAEAVTGGQVARDGTYSWDSSVVGDSGRWHPYGVTVALRVESGAIADITVTPDEAFYESPNRYFFEKARDDFTMRLKGKPATEESIDAWDAVSGATCASNGIQRAARSAIRTADPAATPTTPPAVTETPVPTPSPTTDSTVTPTETPTAVPTAWPTETPMVWPTVPPRVTETPTVTPGHTPGANQTPTATPGHTPGAAQTPTAAPGHTPGAAQTPTAVPTARPTAKPIETPRLDQVRLTQAKGMKRAVQLKWKKVDGAAGYRIYRASSQNSAFKKIRTLKKATTFKDRSVRSKKTYYYRVCAYRTVKGKVILGKRSSIRKASVR